MASDLTFTQLETLWTQAGGSTALAPVMAAIALAESSGDPEALNATDNGGTQSSFGLWQISTGTHTPPSPNWATPAVNAQLAVAKYKEQGLGAWGTYTSGKYKQFLNGNAPVSDSGGSTAASAQTASFIPSWLSGLLGGITGDPTGIGAVMGSILGPVGNTFNNLNSALSDAMRAVLWLINPANWVRIIAGIIGTGALITGIVFVAKSV